MDVVILAGGRCDEELRAATGAEMRADIVVGGRTLLDRVLEATRPLGEPIVVGGPASAPKRVEGGSNFCESLGNGLEGVKTDKFLLVTVDLPCLTTESLQDFVSKCRPSAGLNFPIVRKEDCERVFPGMKRTTLKLKEGEFTGGNVAVMDAVMMRRARPIMEHAYAMRKKPLKLAQIVGLGVLARVAIGKLAPATLPISFLESAVGKFLEIEVHGVISSYPELGADLDKASDYTGFVEREKKQSQG